MDNLIGTGGNANEDNGKHEIEIGGESGKVDAGGDGETISLVL